MISQLNFCKWNQTPCDQVTADPSLHFKPSALLNHIEGLPLCTTVHNLQTFAFIRSFRYYVCLISEGKRSFCIAVNTSLSTGCLPSCLQIDRLIHEASSLWLMLQVFLLTRPNPPNLRSQMCTQIKLCSVCLCPGWVLVKKVISSAQSWLSAAPGSFFIYLFIYLFFSLQLSNYIQAFSTRRLKSMTLNPEAVLQHTTTNVR